MIAQYFQLKTVIQERPSFIKFTQGRIARKSFGEGAIVVMTKLMSEYGLHIRRERLVKKN